MYKNKIDIVLTGIFGMILCICIIFMIKDLYCYKAAEKEYLKLCKDPLYVEMDQFPAEGTNELEIAEDKINTDYFDRLYSINPDLAGILSIPSINLTYPVVQGNDNIKYLSYTFEGKKNPAGCLFMDYENNISFTDGNTYIYGHNMKDGSMFGSLKKMTKEGFDRQDTKAYVLTKEGTLCYKLENIEVVNIDEYKAPKETEGLLTLYTCWGNDKSRRLLVTFSKVTAEA